MEVRHTSLERGLAISFGLVILVVLLFLPVAWFAMNGLTSQAQAMRDIVIRGQLAYAKVASDADSLRAATLEAASNPDQTKAAQQLAVAKTLVKQFPDDARKMLAIFCPPTSNAADATPDCTKVTEGDKAPVAKLADTFNTSASAFDFQALSAVSLLQSGKPHEALIQINGPSSVAYQKQNADGQAMLD